LVRPFDTPFDVLNEITKGYNQCIKVKPWSLNRYWRLLARGKSRQTIITAIAIELSAFIWAIDREVQQVAT
jgi:hypothetical protein